MQVAREKIFQVVQNDELQFSIWRADRALPVGWRGVGFHGSRAQCLEHVNEIWRDMRPLRLQEQMRVPASQHVATADGERVMSA